MSADERTNTKAGKINTYSSMLGPDRNGKPRTELPRGTGAQRP
jgi:hypothetical protein